MCTFALSIMDSFQCALCININLWYSGMLCMLGSVVLKGMQQMAPISWPMTLYNYTVSVLAYLQEIIIDTIELVSPVSKFGRGWSTLCCQACYTLSAGFHPVGGGGVTKR